MSPTNPQRLSILPWANALWFVDSAIPKLELNSVKAHCMGKTLLSFTVP